MKKYTLIYADIFQYGSHRNSITQMKHIECEPDKLGEVIENDMGWCNIWFIFDGHCVKSQTE